MGIAREFCEAIGENPDDYTGYSWRIGMASDLVAMYDVEKAGRITKRWGRWRSEIYFVYQRSGVHEQLQASAHAIDAEGSTIEALLPNWVQPTRGGWRGR